MQEFEKNKFDMAYTKAKTDRDQKISDCNGLWETPLQSDPVMCLLPHYQNACNDTDQIYQHLTLDHHLVIIMFLANVKYIYLVF